MPYKSARVYLKNAAATA